MSRRPHPPTIRDQILQALEILRIPLPEDEFDQLLAVADKERLSHLEFLQRMLSVPANRRRERSVQRRLREAQFRDPGTLETFDWEFNARTLPRQPFEDLATGEFIRRRDNVAFVGQNGMGKSFLIQAIGRRCCALGYRVRYVTSAVEPRPLRRSMILKSKLEASGYSRRSSLSKPNSSMINHWKRL